MKQLVLFIAVSFLACVIRANIICILNEDVNSYSHSSNNSFQISNDIKVFLAENELIKKICKIKIAIPTTSPVHLLTATNHTFAIKTLQSICNDKPKGHIAITSWRNYIDKIRPILEIDEDSYLFVWNATLDTFDSVLTSNAYKNDLFVDVIIEILPRSYEFKNVTYNYYKQNITNVKTIELDRVELENVKSTPGLVNGTISYAYEGKIKANFALNYEFIGLPPKNANINNRELRNTNFTYIANETHIFTENMLANSKVNVTLYGIWSFVEYTVEGYFLLYYGSNNEDLLNTNLQQFTATVRETRLTNIKHKVVTLENANNTGISKPVPLRQSRGVYPEFEPYFRFACVLLFGMLFGALFDISRKLIKERRIKTDVDQYHTYHRMSIV